MDFALEESQEIVARMASDVLASCDPDGAWKALGQAGLLTLTVPVDQGGDGLGVLETAVLLREIGRHGLVMPALPHLATGLLPATRWGKTCDPERLMTAAVNEPSQAMPARPKTRLENGAVTGQKVGVLYADTAALMLVPVADGVALIDPASAHLERTYTSSGAAEFTVTFDHVPVREFWEVDVGELYLLAKVGACALADGLLAGALELTRAHIERREQFGKPIATFQAAAMQIAEVYIASRTMHLAALSAAWRLHTGRDAASDVDTAVTWFAQEVPQALRACHHLHGGIGLDITYPLHRYSAMVKDLLRYVPRPL
jgi:3-oxo-4-pregnene-20-carboxyl-CoA dehydrogenase alpha subunit